MPPQQATPGVPAHRQLPTKEQAMFKKILKFYEQKQYKNGLKACKFILGQPKFSEHGETLALKGLTLNCLNRKEEAYELVKRGLKADLTSHVCWHVFGLLYRSDKNYFQAIKCYRSALRYDKENTQILRDLSLLQVQMRDLEGYKLTRHQLLTIRPTQRASWLGYAISLQLLGQHDEALKVTKAYEKTGNDFEKNDKPDYEHGELVLFQATILRESTKFQEAMDYLDANEIYIVDKIAAREMRAELFMDLKKFDEAEKIWRSLIADNRECQSNYAKLETCLGFNNETPQEQRLKIYEEYQSEYPKAHAPKRLPLFFAKTESFKEMVDTYLRPCIRKGMLASFRNIRHVYENKDADKIAIVESLGLSYLDNMRKHGKFDDKDETKKETPLTLVWILYFVSQHYDKVGNLDKALALINEAIDHTPTILDLYMVKAKIYKHGGNPKEAAKWLNHARELDTADRFINSKCVKYMLRAGDVKTAEDTASLFTRESADPIASLSEMQCVWFETEESKAFLSNGEVGKGLKKLNTIDGHFTQMLEDQFDFHTYCIRKMTLRAYLNLLRAEDKLKSHKLYYNAAITATQTYIGLHDVPFGSKQREEQNAKLAGLTPSQLKKLQTKQRKVARKAAEEKAALDKKKGPQQVQKNEEGQIVEADKDPNGELLAKTKTPLDEAMKFLRPLLVLCPNRVTPSLLAFEIYLRKEKSLMMLKYLKKAMAVAPADAAVAKATTRFLRFYSSKKSTLNVKVVKVIELELALLTIGQTDAAAFVAARLQSNKASFSDVVACAEMTFEVTEDKEKAFAIVSAITDLNSLTNVTVEGCAKAIYFIQSVLKLSADQSQSFVDLSQKHYALADFEHQTHLNSCVV